MENTYANAANMMECHQKRLKSVCQVMFRCGDFLWIIIHGRYAPLLSGGWCVFISTEKCLTGVSVKVRA